MCHRKLLEFYNYHRQQLECYMSHRQQLDSHRQLLVSMCVISYCCLSLSQVRGLFAGLYIFTWLCFSTGFIMYYSM